MSKNKTYNNDKASTNKSTKRGADYRIEVKKLKEKYIQELKTLKIAIEKELSCISNEDSLNGNINEDDRKFNINQLNCTLIDINTQLNFFNNQYLSADELNSLQWIKEILDLFTETQQKVIKLLVFDKKCTSEIAKILCVTEDAINKHFTRILKRIQDNETLNSLLKTDNSELIVDDKIKLSKLNNPQETINRLFGSLLKNRVDKAETARKNAIESFKLFEEP